MKIGSVELPNRFVRSATYDSMAGESGEISNRLIERYVRLARGNVGLIISGLMHVQSSGRGYKYQAGIHQDRMIPGLKTLTDAVHQFGGRIAFQLAHCGRQSTKKIAGRIPLAPSSRGRDPLNFVKPMAMTEEQIVETVNAFGDAARRSVEAGADGIQLHGAHGYLISEFLSPFFNVRNDVWGGSTENRFRFLKEIVVKVKSVVPDGFPVLVKLNANDHLSQEGVIPAIAVKYAGWLAALGIDGVEISCGTSNYSFMNMCRGKVPTAELLKSLAWWEKPIGKMMIGKLEGRFDLEEGYNLNSAKLIKTALGKTPLMLVGGMRTVSHMEAVLKNNDADFISMSRPFIREPFLVKKIQEEKVDGVTCVSCNRCLAAIPNELPVYCYKTKFPKA